MLQNEKDYKYIAPILICIEMLIDNTIFLSSRKKLNYYFI